jgi:phage terminase small subunit
VALTPKRAGYAREFIKDRNATQAAIRAGYSPKTAGVQGHALLKIPEVAEEIARLESLLTKDALVTAAEVINGLRVEAKGADQASARVAAWGLLGKHLALFTDKTEVAGKDGGPLVVEVITYTEETDP